MIKVLNDQGYVELVSHMGDDLTIVNAARVSMARQSEAINLKDEKLIKYLMKNEHTSPFEHVVFTFLVKCPLFVRSQWMRHRTWSYNEISRRYTSEDIDFYLPISLRAQSANDKQSSDCKVIAKITNVAGHEMFVDDYIKHVSNIGFALYQELLSNGVSREQARMVLPQNLMTQFYATVNLHNLFHFIHLRNSEHAQFEIRVYANAIERIIEPIVPVAYRAWRELKDEKTSMEIVPLSDGNT